MLQRQQAAAFCQQVQLKEDVKLGRWLDFLGEGNIQW